MTVPADSNSLLVDKVISYVETYMSAYDASHDFHHIKRVLALSHLIASASTPSTSTPQPYDPLTLTLSALLHDVGDKKYLLPGQDATTLIRNVLLSFDAPQDLADKIQTIASAVSYSSEIRDPQKVKDVIALYPELAAVQDADRLDAIGAVGIGRCFAFGGAMGAKGAPTVEGQGGSRTLQDTIGHFGEKLEKLEGMMKTEKGRELARERTERLLVFQQWWKEELEEAGVV